MPIDPALAVAGPIRERARSWTADDVILYHLGLGIGLAAPPGAEDLRWLYEDDLRVLPAFGVIPVMDALLGVNEHDGLDVDMRTILHGEQELLVHRPLPVAAEARTTARVSAVVDKGAASLVVLEVRTLDASGEPLTTNRSTLFVRGDGGHGSAGTPPQASRPRPDRAPDHEVASPTLPGQALLYRLSGDKNPLHADPELARAAGFDRPILHGLCTFGIACRAVVDTVLDGDPSALAALRVRFTSVVFPGDTITTALWRESDRIHVEASTPAGVALTGEVELAA